MKTIHIIKQLAIAGTLTMGMASSLHAGGLLGGGAVGGSVGGTIGGGSIGGAFGGGGNAGGSFSGASSFSSSGFGQPAHGATIGNTRMVASSMRGNAAADVESKVTRNAASVQGSASGSLSRNLSPRLDTEASGNSMVEISGQAGGGTYADASVSGNTSVGMHGDAAGKGKQALADTARNVHGVAQPIRDGAKSQVSNTRGYAQSSVANTRGMAQASKQAAISGAKQSGNAVRSSAMQNAAASNADVSLHGSGGAAYGVQN